jgi:hypothetical protein
VFHRSSFKLASFPAVSWRRDTTGPTLPPADIYPSAGPPRRKRARRKRDEELLFIRS